MLDLFNDGNCVHKSLSPVNRVECSDFFMCAYSIRLRVTIQQPQYYGAICVTDFCIFCHLVADYYIANT